ncbi:MAG: hypothetical protein U0361_21825 [Nitrospiraceae bacterium]
MKRFLALYSIIRSTMIGHSLIFMPGIPPILSTTDFSRLSLSIKKLAEVTMCSPSFRPVSTSDHSPVLTPVLIRRGSSFPAQMEKDGLLFVPFDDGFLRDRQTSAQLYLQLHIGIPIRFQLLVSIIELKPHLGGAGLPESIVG